VRHDRDELVLAAVGVLGIRPRRALALEQLFALALRTTARMVQRADEQRDEYEHGELGDRLLAERERRPRRRHHRIERHRREHRRQQAGAQAAEPGAGRHRRHEQRRRRRVGQGPDGHADDARDQHATDADGHAHGPRRRRDRFHTRGQT